MENREEERKLLDAAGVDGRVLSMKDGGQEVGYVIVDLQEGTLLLRKLAAKGYDFTQRPQGEELFILDTLMRSAASWGEDHGAERHRHLLPGLFRLFQGPGLYRGRGARLHPHEHHSPLRAGRALKPENPARCLPVS